MNPSSNVTALTSDALGILCGTLVARELVDPTIQLHQELVSWRTSFQLDAAWSNTTATRERNLQSLVEQTGALLGSSLLSSYRQVVLQIKQIRLSLALATAIDQHFDNLLNMTSWEGSHVRTLLQEQNRFKEVLLFQRLSVITIEDRLYHWRCSSTPDVISVLKQVRSVQVITRWRELTFIRASRE